MSYSADAAPAGRGSRKGFPHRHNRPPPPWPPPPPPDPFGRAGKAMVASTTVSVRIAARVQNSPGFMGLLLLSTTVLLFVRRFQCARRFECARHFLYSTVRATSFAQGIP